MKKLSVLLFVLISSLLEVPLYAQVAGEVSEAGSLVFSTGEGFQLIREGNPEEYDLAVDNTEGIRFYPGDYVNTYENTFLEIELTDSRHLLKISENTSFLFEQGTKREQNSFMVNYGRVRARVKKLAGLESFTIDGPSVVAGVRGTDFGYDVLYDSGASAPVSTVYCFEGEIAVSPKVEIIETTGFAEDEAEKIETTRNTSLILLADEMLKLEGAAGIKEGVFRLQKSSVNEEISVFWDQNDFISGAVMEAPVQMPVTEKPEKDPRIRFTASKMRRGGWMLGGVGAVFGAAAATFIYADPLLEDMSQATRDNLSLSMGIAGGIFLGTSLVLLIGSLFSS